MFLWVIQGDSVRLYFDRHVNFILIECGENTGNMFSLRASKQILRACNVVSTPFLRCFLHTSKPSSTFAKDLFLGRINKVGEDFFKFLKSVLFCRKKHL